LRNSRRTLGSTIASHQEFVEHTTSASDRRPSPPVLESCRRECHSRRVTNAAECLDEPTVLAFIAGRVVGDDVDAHLASCPACCDLVVHAARTSFAVGTPARAEPTPSVADTVRASPRAKSETDIAAPAERYTISALIGSGGQALVYKAHDNVLGRTIALKLLRDTHDAGVLDEARLAAKLNHPNIVAIHDAGRLPTGQVYLAMEHVAGGSLDRWLSRARRSRAEIVRVLVEAGRGLAVAHEAGIVHRDIKSANILVGDDGRARVTDFGLATLGDRALVAGTLPYMAPEQLDGEATAASDQFGFAATAWEALTGTLPYRITGDRAAAIAAGIVEPAQPLPRSLDRTLRRGLEPQAARRWPSMRALIDALSADPARRWKIAGAGAVAIAIGTTTFALAARPAEESGPSCVYVPTTIERDQRARIDRAFAASRKPFAAAVRTRVVAELDAYAAAIDAQRTDACRATRAGTQSAELLDLREQCLYERSRALAAVGEVFARAGDAEIENGVALARGLPSIDPCADRTWLVERVRSPRDIPTQIRVTQIAERIATSTAQLRAGKIPQAVATADAALADARGVDHLPTRARAELAAGQARAKLGETKTAEQHLQDAAQLAQRGKDDLTAADAWIELVKVIGHGNGRYEEALRYAGFADATAARLGRSTEQRARLAYYRCAIFDLQAKLEDATRACDEAVAAWTQARGQDAPEIADVLVVAARVAYKSAKRDVAESTIARALAIRETALGKEHPAIMEALFAQGQFAIGAGKLDIAQAAFERGMQIGRAALGEDTLPMAALYSQMASLLERRGDFAAALASIERSSKIRMRVAGGNHPDMIFNYIQEARILESLKRDGDAEIRYYQAYAIIQKTLAGNHPSLTALLQDLGRLHGRMGKTAEARNELEQAIQVAKTSEEPLAIASATTALAEFFHLGNKPALAIPLYLEALATYEKLLGPEHPQLGPTLQNLGLAYIDTKKPKDALAPLARAVALEAQVSGATSALLLPILDGLGDAQVAAGDRAAARATWERAIALDDAAPADVATVKAKLVRLPTQPK
jgi:tetratricopeptide (TPR) repeat protein